MNNPTTTEARKRPCAKCGRGIRWGQRGHDGEMLTTEASILALCYDCRIADTRDKRSARLGRR